MIRIVEKANGLLKEAKEKVDLQNFFNRIGRKATCRLEYTTKSGVMDIASDPPAFCGFSNGVFFLTVPQGSISVNFPLRSIMYIEQDTCLPPSVRQEHYVIHIKDGSYINLRI